MVKLPSQLRTPEVGSFAIANCTFTVDDEHFKYHELPAGTAVLVVEVCGMTTRLGQKYGMKIVHDEKAYYVPRSIMMNFLYCKPGFSLANKSFCITGDLTFIRPMYATLIRLSGGEYKSGVSGNLGYLITNETRLSTKMRKAKQLGTSIITEDQFMGML